MNVKRNMYEEISEHLHTIKFYSLYPLTLVIVLAIKLTGFQKPGKLSLTFLQCIMVTLKIKNDFYLGFSLFQTKKYINSWLKR